MKSPNHRRGPLNPGMRWTLLSLMALALMVCASSLLFRTQAANPAGGGISPGGPTLNWVGDAPGTGAQNGEGNCMDSGPNRNCDSYALNVTGTPADWAGKLIEIKIHWANSADDYDLYVHKGSVSGPVATHGTNGGQPGNEESAFLDVQANGVGLYTVHIGYATTPPVANTDQYQATAFVVSSLLPPANQATGFAPRYQNYTPPIGSGLGVNAFEPSIGANWATRRTLLKSDFQFLRVNFNDACDTQPASTWENKQAPTSAGVDQDPILFTDHQTNRSFVSELTLISPTAKGSVTDDDGDSWIPSQGSGIASGIDHQTIGGGPYHLDPTTHLAPPHSATYPNAVYYCSQDLVTALCSRSDDGGVTYGPSVPVYTSECVGIHGHVKVDPDSGTVYVPNRSCGGQQGLAVSEDNGITWSIRKVGNASVVAVASSSDPSLGIGAKGRLYFGYAHGDHNAGVAVSNDHGLTWTNLQDVGAGFGIKNLVFPAVVAGDEERAAFAFLGTQTPGNLQDANFQGIWHLYVAHTFDGGNSWTTVDATPNDPVQRGCIWLAGGANICRNLADFMDVTVDERGRVEVGYPDGCTGGPCAQAPAGATGDGYTAFGTIARQSGGRRLFAAYDPPEAATAPGMPLLNVRRDGSVVHLSWSEADDGGSAVMLYKIKRGTASGAETEINQLQGTQLSYDDTTASDAAQTYYYKVTAINAVGESCANNEVAAPFMGTSCAGLTVATDPTGDAKDAMPGHDVQSVSVAEPYFKDSSNKLLFKLKVASLSSVPPKSRWRVVWNSPAATGGQYYVGMKSDNNGAVTFDYGYIATGVVGLVVGVPTETPLGVLDAGSNYNPDGTITLVISKSKVGSPQVGDLLGAISGRTFDNDTDTSERSTLQLDATANVSQADVTSPATTYILVGNNPPVNFALNTLGALASASTTYSLGGYPASSANDGEHRGLNWGNGGGWNDDTRDAWPDSLQIDLNGAKTISEIKVYSLQDNYRNPVEPTPDMTCTYYGLLDFDVQAWDGAQWNTVPGGHVTGNDKVMRVIDFPSITTTKIRVVVNNARVHYSRIAEVEACDCQTLP